MLDEPVAGMSVSERVKTAELLNRIIKGRSVLRRRLLRTRSSMPHC
jgi:ABC-type uncharacterized transport system ATPase subunit